MNKNMEMFKCFLKVLRNDKNEINKILPNMYVKSFYDIDVNYLKEKKINHLILDIDNTILPVDSIKVPIKLKKQISNLKKQDINICLMSNNNKNRVEPVAKELGVFYLANAKKPLKEAYNSVLETLKEKDKNKIAAIGDQMMSDIKGANEYGIYSVLVRPISNHNNIQTKTSRILQNIMENHLKKHNIFDKNKYYNERVVK